jgi:phosphoadenosine phosphosulfate reductase
VATSEWIGRADQQDRELPLAEIPADLAEKASAASDFLEQRLDGVADACMTCSFQASGVVLLHLIRGMAPEIPVLFVDTGYHFQETLDYRDRMAARWQLNLINLLPERSVAEQEADFGLLNQTSPDRCCSLRKVDPVFRALQDYRVWVTGLQRNQSRSRAHLQQEESFLLPSGHRLRKLNPLAEWTARDVWRYAEAYAIPLLPLYDLGYSSIGCAPCTNLPLDPGDPRSGRWGGQKLECGIHVQQ